MAAQADANSTRAKALARRKAMSTGGKAAVGGQASASSGARAAASSTAAPASRPVRTASAGASNAGGSTRKASLERRRAMSTMGKRAITKADRVRELDERVGKQRRATADAPVSGESKGDCGCGCKARGERKATDSRATAAQDTAAPATGKTRARRGKKRAAIVQSTAKAASLARRKAQSARGKAGISKNGMSEAQTARAANPQMSSRELAKALRDQRSRRGSSGQKKSTPTGRRRKKTEDSKPGAAKDAPWKVGASETSYGQTVTGTMVGRSQDVTGDEPSTCRDITGTDYLGADIFRDFCQADPAPGTAKKVVVTTTSHGNAVSGNRIGRGEKVTGNEQGTCKNVTGNEYTSAEQQQGYCGEFASKSARKVSMAETMKGKAVTGNNIGRSERVTGDEPGMGRSLTGTQYTKPSDIGNAPAKVGTSTTLRGGSVTGTTVGRREHMTGDEAGSCRNVTGDDYVGQEQFSGFCSATPEPQDQKVGVSATNKGQNVTGTLTDRAGKVTGNEPGSCKAVTGTPYTGAEQTANFCQAEDAALVSMRTKQGRGTPGMPMTGIQPGIGGVMTGADKGACESLTGTPYVGADQFAGACPATAADTASPDFPQAIGGNAVGQQFSVEQPSGGTQQAMGSTGVTGNQYEMGVITGPFGMAGGKVTGTEEARFGAAPSAAVPVAVDTAKEIDGRVKSRISGEGQDAGSKITGDDWERGDHVTGTEGRSAQRRNPTIRGPGTTVMGARAVEPRETPQPVSKVTGSSGNTENGSLITYSGGARG